MNLTVLHRASKFDKGTDQERKTLSKSWDAVIELSWRCDFLGPLPFKPHLHLQPSNLIPQTSQIIRDNKETLYNGKLNRGGCSKHLVLRCCARYGPSLMMTEMESHFTVFIRLPFDRGDFVDPRPVAWSAAKERALWDIISRQGQGKGNEIDWHALAIQFEVTQSFILQQAAWLYERQLSHVRAQLKRVSNRQSATPSPAPGSMTSSLAGGQPMKRTGSGGSRVPSRLSTQHVGNPSLGGEGSTPPTPAKSRTSLLLKTGPASAQPTQVRTGSISSRPLSRQPSKEDSPAAYSQSRRSSIHQPLSRSPGQANLQLQGSDSEEDVSPSKASARRAHPPYAPALAPSLRQGIQAKATKQGTEEEDDAPNFLPFAAEADNVKPPSQTPTSPQDPGATIRGGFESAQRPPTHRRSTSERIVSPSKRSTATDQTMRPSTIQQNLSSSGSSLSNSQPNPKATPPTSVRMATRPGSTATATLSPRQQAVLRQQRHGSESSPSMGSSFSDLDDASVTQSALEEALMSNMGNTTNTMASKVSGISQAIRSRYFDARQGPGSGQGGGGTGRGEAKP